MKCFERAAEKCHTDSLASVVSSCLWGKHVAIGTGSPFQILWNKEQVSCSIHITSEKGIYILLFYSTGAVSSTFMNMLVSKLVPDCWICFFSVLVLQTETNLYSFVTDGRKSKYWKRLLRFS